MPLTGFGKALKPLTTSGSSSTSAEVTGFESSNTESSRRVVLEGREVDDAGISALGRSDDVLVQLEVRALAQARSDRGRRLAQLAELRVDQAPLERRDHDQVHEQQRPSYDERKAERQTAADVAERVHRSRKR